MGDYRIQKKFKEAIRYVLQPPPESNFLIINRTSNDLTKLAENAARDLGLNVDVFNLNLKGPYRIFPSELETLIRSEKYPRAVGFFTYPTGTDYEQRETPARVELIHDLMEKVPIGYAHAPGITRDMALNGAVQCDYQEMSKKAEKMLEILKGAKALHVSAPSGTNITIEMPHKLKWETDCAILPPGVYGDAGKVGNFPVGECFIERRQRITAKGKEVSYPIKLPSTGRIVCDVCADGIEKLVESSKPIEVQLRDGIVTYIHSEDTTFDTLALDLMKREQEYSMPGILEEVGIGINPNARRIANLLEAEKLDSTIHFGVGHVRYHSDYIVNEPTITLLSKNGREKTIMEDGKLLAG